MLVNLAAHGSQCYTTFNVPELETHDWIITDLLGEQRFVRGGADLKSKGLYFDLPAHGAQLFHLQPLA